MTEIRFLNASARRDNSNTGNEAKFVLSAPYKQIIEARAKQQEG
jgi:hypothetical protein